MTSLVPGPGDRLAWALVAVSALVVFLGALVTGSGPYSGDAESENRFSFDPRTISWLHADVVLLFLGLLVGLLVALAVVRAPARARRRAWLLLGIALAQGLLGYTQYFAGLPDGAGAHPRDRVVAGVGGGAVHPAGTAHPGRSRRRRRDAS